MPQSAMAVTIGNAGTSKNWLTMAITIPPATICERNARYVPLLSLG